MTASGGPEPSRQRPFPTLTHHSMESNNEQSPDKQ